MKTIAWQQDQRIAQIGSRHSRRRKSLETPGEPPGSAVKSGAVGEDGFRAPKEVTLGGSRRAAPGQ